MMCWLHSIRWIRAIYLPHKCASPKNRSKQSTFVMELSMIFVFQKDSTNFHSGVCVNLIPCDAHARWQIGTYQKLWYKITDDSTKIWKHVKISVVEGPLKHIRCTDFFFLSVCLCACSMLEKSGCESEKHVKHKMVRKMTRIAVTFAIFTLHTSVIQVYAMHVVFFAVATFFSHSSLTHPLLRQIACNRTSFSSRQFSLNRFLNDTKNISCGLSRKATGLWMLYSTLHIDLYLSISLFLCPVLQPSPGCAELNIFNFIQIAHLLKSYRFFFWVVAIYFPFFLSFFAQSFTHAIHAHVCT